MTDPWRYGVRDVVAAMGSGRCTAAALVRSLQARAAELEHLHAWAATRFEEALEEASALDSAVDAGSPSSRPLSGVPFGVKDVIATETPRTDLGVWPPADFGPVPDAEIVRRIRAAGGLVVGKTTTTAFAGADPAPTHNPWDGGHTPGGSSAGSAAAVAAGLVPVAIGTQTAGSVLRPAAFCGVVGFKPSFGELPTAGVFPFASTLDTIGIMTRSVDDAVCVHAALTHDSCGARAGGPPPLLIRLDVGSLTTSSIERRLNAALERAESAGARVERGSLPVDLDLVLHVHRVLVHASAYQVHGGMLEQRPTLYGPRLARTVRLGALVPPDVYARALALQQELAARMAQALPKGAVFVLPTASSAPDMASTGDPRLQSIASTLGLPAITIPTGRDVHGLPLGTQLVGSYGKDVELLAAAGWFEACAGTGLQDLAELWRVLEPARDGTRSDRAARPSTTVAGFL